jgi:hypothetical protein
MEQEVDDFDDYKVNEAVFATLDLINERKMNDAETMAYLSTIYANCEKAIADYCRREGYCEQLIKGFIAEYRDKFFTAVDLLLDDTTE